MKTYLDRKQQWERTVELYLKYDTYARGGRRFDHGTTPRIGDECYLGQIVQPHRLFVPGDMVIVELSNGAAERQLVWAVSSKGYKIRRYYLGYRRWSPKIRVRHRDTYIRIWGPGELRGFDSGPMRFVELPDDLRNRCVDDPVVLRWVTTVDSSAQEMPYVG